MKKFNLVVLTIILAATIFLKVVFRYSFEVIGYHLIVMLIVQLLLQLLLAVLFLLTSNRRVYSLMLHTLCFLNLLTLVQFYVFVLGSNSFWGKTITLDVIKNYATKFGSLIDALPIEPWTFYASIALLFLLIIGLYLLCRPNATKIYQRFGAFRNKTFTRSFCLVLLGVAALTFLLRAPIVKAKRAMHFSEEPFLQFTLGNIWGDANERVFDKTRYLLGEKDKPCLDSLHIKPNTDNHPVVVILLDALRSDHLSMYGYSRKTTPFLDSLYDAKKLFTVRNFFSPSTNTLGGVEGLFFSRDWESFGYTGLNLMKYLKTAGYTTYAFLSGYHRNWLGLADLYISSCDHYYESPKNSDSPPDDDLVTLQQFQASPLDKKPFIYIHLLSTHEIGRKQAQFKKYKPDKLGFGVRKDTALINNYDNGILQADYVISEVFKKLEQAGLLENSTVMILADHGELFGEGGQWSHGGSVQPKLITIPLLVYDQHPEWYLNKEASTLQDIAPTIVDRLNYPLPACWEGVSMHKAVHNFTLKINAVAECDYPFGLLTKKESSYKLDVLDGKHKFVKTISFTP